MRALARPEQRTDAGPRRIAGLDGLRAIAVILAVGFHLVPAALPGGFIGVDMFFVLSGFLITTILLREHAARGRLSLRTFWMHRLRRLGPALVLTVVGTTALVGLAITVLQVRGQPAAGSLWGDLLVGVGVQLGAAATFTSNWVTVALGQGYATSATPRLFENLWSLAVEEQFYLLWPLVVMGVLAWGVAARRAAWAAALLAACSAVAMAFAAAGADPTRAYMGTDTHAFGLMLGAALAFAWRGGQARRPTGATRTAALGAGAAGAAVIAALALLMPWDAPWTYRGGLLAASVAAAAVIGTVLAVPGVGRRLDAAPLRWIGDRSYGIYLWHWPLLVIVAAAVDQGPPSSASPLAVVLTAAATVAIAAASYRWIEAPVRRLGFRGAFRALEAWLRPEVAQGRGIDATRARRAALAGGAAAATVALSTSAVASAPHQTALESRLEAGASVVSASVAYEAAVSEPEAFEADEAGEAGEGTAPWFGGPFATGGAVEQPLPPRAGGARDETGSVSAASEVRAVEADGPIRDVETVEEAAEEAAHGPSEDEAPAPRKVPAGKEITVVGDSVTLGSAPALAEALPGVAVDAEVGRQFAVGVDRIAQLARKDRLRPYVVVALGTNGAVTPEEMDRLLRVVGDRTVVLVTPYGDRSWMAGSQKQVRAAAKRHDNVVLADWQRAVEADPGLLGPDGIHPDDEGSAVFATVVKRALRSAVSG
ncbi:acyltransferase family protein [Demequina mangrovi]|uniref:Peptidoglycan/LPS O-acetylase OafA/YrhL, contains acyltransferase and SGNH-hydrolase domains n=1 Tax=Demequina mangrovi TaxID=1043493 RepID=A0A1H6UWX2_9MICO|nr:acyltransferase family protein [Demequina mangrovi]SEI96166.1 Peptidoglycan/LPS O-acetylase OafA/YrhL, contains acyltransferase and SGNH-hydrolase domains [Demequina mangrovi]